MTSRQYFYELVGAPSLLYRHTDSYTPLDEPPTLGAAAFLSHHRCVSRARARWYYPIDFAAIRGALRAANAGDHGGDDASTVPDGESDAASTLDQEDTDETFLEEMSVDRTDEECHFPSDWDPRLVRAQSLGLQQEARECLLLGDLDVQDDPEEYRKRRDILLQYCQYDVNYLPRKRQRHDQGAHVPSKAQLSETEVRMTRRLDVQRMNFSEPAYLAPFDELIVKDLARDDLSLRFPTRNIPESGPTSATDGGPIGRTSRQNFHYNDLERHDSPLHYGNCVVTVPCPCPFCRDSDRPSWCLLHATGLLLDRVQCSFLRFPGDGPVILSNSSTPLALVDVGDTLKQLEECGTNVFIARTDLHCTVFQLTAAEPWDSSLCSCAAAFKILHRIDARCINRTQPSCRPVDLTCHQKYGRAWTDPNIVVLYDDDERRERKTLRHIQAGDALRATSHYISNLQIISKIEFSSHHPMVLWSIARSYVRPVLAASETSTRHPRTGHGYSLYSVDLRSDQAAFQWSPSAEEYRVEGTHSLSGILVDWRKDHTVWASSVSCGKTWEIDTRMPCRAVCSWSLPFLSDDTDTSLSPTAFYGAGTLLVQPEETKATPLGSTATYPTLAVNLDPCSHSIHLYQQPSNSGRYQTNNLETPASPALAFLNDTNIAASSTFTLPDASEKVFTCGLKAIALPVSRILSPETLSQLGYQEIELDGALFVVSTTNKGDVYAHTLLASRSSYCRSKRFENLPVGSSSTPVPVDTTGILASLSCDMFSGPGRIAVPLEQQYPCPSGAISFPSRNDPATVKDANTSINQTVKNASIIPSITSNTTLLMTSKHYGGDISKEELELVSQDEFANAFESFDHIMPLSHETDADDDKTDLTKGLLMKVTAAWPKSDG